MKTKQIIEDLRCCNSGSCAECTMDMKPGCTDELMIAAEKKLQAVHEDVGRCKKKIADLKKELAEREAAPGWISVEDIPVPPEKYFVFTVLPKIIIKRNPETGEPAYWMPLPEPPKPKAKTYKDVFFDIFPDGDMDAVQSRLCINIFFPLFDRPERCVDCEECWNQPYPVEVEGEGEPPLNYCPECGAKMDGGDENDDGVD